MKHETEKRKSGIALAGDLPWGSHFCQFYRTKKDLLDILIPYFRAGLECNELCIWITSEPLGAGDAGKALQEAVPHFKDYGDKGQMEIIPERHWRTQGGLTHEAVVSRLDKAISGGFDGLRLAYSAVPERRGDEAFVCDEVDIISRYNTIAVFSYPRDEFDAAGLREAVKNHRFALVRNAGRWERIEGSEVRTVKDALRRSEEKLHSLFNNMFEGFAYHRILLDAEGKPCDYVFHEVNEAFERLTGLKRENIIGRRVTRVLPGIENDPAGWIGKYGHVALTGSPVQFESYSEALDKWYSVSAFSPHKGYFAVAFSDITERKRMEQALRESAEKLRCTKEEWELTFDAVPDLVAILDNEHRIVRVNRAMADRLGITPDQCRGLRCYEAVHGMSETPGFCPHSLTCWDGRQHVAEVQEPRLGGHFLVSTTPLCDHLGRVTGAVHVARDITARKQAEQELRKAYDDLELRVRERTSELRVSNKALVEYAARLERLNTELQDFSFVAAHDLQEPLRKIQTFCDMAVKRCAPTLDSAGREYLDRVVSSAGQMRQLLRDLLGFSRTAARPGPFKEIDLARTAREAADFFEEDLEGSGGWVEIEGMAEMEADEDQMRCLFQNLIDNALKFRSEENPRIKIHARQDRGRLEIIVKDNGIGFDPQYAERIFKPFQKLHSRREYDGTGMGLAVCRKIVEWHGGSIKAKSEPGEGSTFQIRLPASHGRKQGMS